MSVLNFIKRYMDKKGDFDGICEIPESERILTPMTLSCKASVVIPTYNEAAIIANGLETFASQSLNTSDFELIVVDNNSKDKTVDIVTNWIKSHNCKNIFLLNEKNKGVTAARRRGFDEAALRYRERGIDREHYILSADADNWVAKDWIEQYIKDFSVTNADLLSGRTEFDTSKIGNFPRLLEFINFRQTLGEFVKKIYVGRAEGSNFGIKLSAYAKVGGFKRLYMWGDDAIAPIPTDDWRFSTELVALKFHVAISEAKVKLNIRKFASALEDILGGTLYLAGWEEHASKQQKPRDLTTEELIALKQSQVQGIIAHQMLINTFANPKFLDNKDSLNFLGEKLSKRLLVGFEKAKLYCGFNKFSFYSSYYVPAYFLYFKFGAEIITRLNKYLPDYNLQFILPKHLEPMKEIKHDWERNFFIMGFLNAPSHILGKYFGSWM